MATHQASAGTPKSRFERTVEILAEGLGNSIGWLADHGVLFGVFALLWAVVGLAMVLNPGALTDVWQQIGQLPVYVQAILWLLFLPVMAGVWIWHTDWPELLRIASVLALAAFTLLVMRPPQRARAAQE